MAWRILKNGAPTPWGAFLLALIVRLLWVGLVGDPLLYTHPYQYLGNAQWIAESPDPLNVVLHYDNWRVQYDRWTAAPLYYLFLAALFRIFGPSLAVVYWIQCGLGALGAASLTAIGSRLGGARGRQVAWLYAFYLPAVAVCGTTLTEALHTPLLLMAFEGVLRSGASLRKHLASGIVHGLAALTRSVSSAFFVLLAVHRAIVLGGRRALGPVIALAVGGCLTILPWTARNYFLMDEPILIETYAFENLWFSNTFARPGFKEQQRQDIVSRPTLREQRQAAIDWTWRNLRRNPDRIVPKIIDNIEHLLRPDGLYRFTSVRATMAGWRYAAAVLLEDLPWTFGWLGALSFFLWGRPSPAKLLVVFWLGYSLFMLVVVFQNEVRYRSILAPFIFAATLSGWGRGPRTGRAAAATLSAILLGISGTGSLCLQALQFAPGSSALLAGDHREAKIARGFRALRAGRLDEALGGLGEIPPSVDDVRGPMAQAWLHAELGHADLARSRAAQFHAAEWEIDPTLLQEAAWESLPAPSTNRVEIAGLDIGAIRGFSYPWPRDLNKVPPLWRYGAPTDTIPHRWTRSRSWIRFHLSWSGPARLTIRMGTPAPYRGGDRSVSITAGGQTGQFRLSPEMRDFSFDTQTVGAYFQVRIDSPTWNRSDQPSSQGIRIDWARVDPR